MNKVYCFCTPHSGAVQALCGGSSGLIRQMYAWPLPDGSGEVVVFDARTPAARSVAGKIPGTTLLPHPHSPTPLTPAILAIFSSLNLPSSCTTAEALYEIIETKAQSPIFSPHV